MNTLIRKVFYSLPVSLRYGIRRVIYLPEDILKKRNPLVPPKGLLFVGSGDYLKIGEQFFGHFQKYCNLTPNSAVLDIGCGIGRMAVPFTKYLSPEGRYEGFDIVKFGIDWCTKNITSRYPNFNFRVIPLKNDLYRLDTEKKAAELKFPYENESFNFVFLTSVFTHMLPADVENYLAEIHRVLKKNEECFATFFIIDEEMEHSKNPNARKKFLHNFGNYFLMDKNVKEANVAYKKKYIMDTLKKHNFEVTNFIKGSWSGTHENEFSEHQDIIIFKKL